MFYTRFLIQLCYNKKHYTKDIIGEGFCKFGKPQRYMRVLIGVNLKKEDLEMVFGLGNAMFCVAVD